MSVTAQLRQQRARVRRPPVQAFPKDLEPGLKASRRAPQARSAGSTVEDTKALTSLVEAIVGASVVADRIFGEDRAADARRAGAWKARHSRNRHYA